MSLPALKIEDLRKRPDLFEVVADRIWKAWWQPYDEPPSDVHAALSEVVEAQDFPFSLVATIEGRFAGTVTAIDTDIDERPDLQPCLAALWVEPEKRGEGIAAALIDAVLHRVAAAGTSRIYLSAKPHLRGFYDAKGWTLMESKVGLDRLDIFLRALP